MFNIFLPEIDAPNSTELSVVGSTHVEVHERPIKNMEFINKLYNSFQQLEHNTGIGSGPR